MIGILIEINGLHQLNKMDSGTEPRLHRQFLNFLNNASLEDMTSRNCLYFQLPYRDEDNRKLWEGIKDVYDYLFENREEYQGFLILVDRAGNLRLSEGFLKLRQKSYAVREIDALVITPRAKDNYIPFFETEQKGSFLVLKPRDRWSIPGKSEGSSFFNREKLVERISQRLIPEIEEAESSELLHFYGSDGIGKFYNIRESIISLRGTGTKLPLPVLSGSEGLKGDFQEILESLDPDFLPRVPGFLSANEQYTWDSRSFLISEGVSEHRPEDIFLIFRLYLKAYSLACREALFPPYILCKDVEQVSAESLTVLVKIITETLPKGSILPVFISRDNLLPPEMDGFPCRRIRVTPLSLKEVEERLKQAGIGKMNTFEIRERTEGHVLYLSHFIMLIRNGISVPETVKGKDLSFMLLKQLDLRLQKILYGVSLFPGLTDRAHWAEILEKNEILRQGAGEALQELTDYGFLSSGHWIRPTLSGIHSEVILGRHDKELIRNSVAGISSSLWAEHQFFSVYSFLQGIFTGGGDVGFSRQFYDYISRMLERGQAAKAEVLLEVFQNLFPSEGNDPLSETVIHALGLRSALIQGDREMARVRFLSFKEFSEAPLSLTEALANLETARYQYALGENRKALDACKKALLFLQEEGNSLLKADANCQIGLIMMGMGRLDEGAMYFSLSREELSPRLAPHNYIKTLILEGLCQFLLGNHSQVARLLEQAREKAGAFGRRDWESYSIFLLGRNAFELGRYEKAEEFFIQGLLSFEIYDDEPRKKVLKAWTARSLIYQRRYNGALNILGSLEPDDEVLFFTAEALYFLERPERALEALELAFKKRNSSTLEFCPGEFISWKTGFTSVEDRALRTREGTGVLLQLIRVFRGYLWGRGKEKEEGLQELSRIIRDERICEEDPYNHFYYYLYNLIVPEMGDAESVNKLTILSRALKYLQARASRIDETKDKQDYLNKNYWNRLLMTEGRNQKII